MLKMHYPRRESISATLVVLTGTHYSNGCGKRIAKSSNKLLEPKKVHRYCIGWGKDSVSLTQIVWSYFLKGRALSSSDIKTLFSNAKCFVWKLNLSQYRLLFWFRFVWIQPLPPFLPFFFTPLSRLTVFHLDYLATNTQICKCYVKIS